MGTVSAGTIGEGTTSGMRGAETGSSGLKTQRDDEVTSSSYIVSPDSSPSPDSSQDRAGTKVGRGLRQGVNVNPLLITGISIAGSIILISCVMSGVMYLKIKQGQSLIRTRGMTDLRLCDVELASEIEMRPLNTRPTFETSI